MLDNLKISGYNSPWRKKVLCLTQIVSGTPVNSIHAEKQMNVH
jgi:hypothetical protein